MGLSRSGGVMNNESAYRAALEDIWGWTLDGQDSIPSPWHRLVMVGGIAYDALNGSDDALTTTEQMRLMERQFRRNLYELYSTARELRRTVDLASDHRLADLLQPLFDQVARCEDNAPPKRCTSA